MSIEQWKQTKERNLERLRVASENSDNQYNRIRDEHPAVPEDVRATWRKADRAALQLRQAYQEIARDPDLTSEARARRAQETHARLAPQIQADRQAVRERLLKAAKTSERGSYPIPPGESLSSNDPTKLLTDQNEAARIVRTVERIRSNPGPLKPDIGRLLREEYERGLETGGVEGGSLCRGVLRAARELDVGEEWLNPLRQERHRDYVEQAWHRHYFAGLVSQDAPAAPREFERTLRREKFAEAQRHQVLAGKHGPPLATSEPSHGGRTRKKKAG